MVLTNSALFGLGGGLFSVLAPRTLDQCWFIFNWAVKNNLPWNLYAFCVTKMYLNYLDFTLITTGLFVYTWNTTSRRLKCVCRCRKYMQRLGGTRQWRHNGRDGVSNHQPHDCLLNRLFKRRSKKTSKHRVTGLCTGNSPVTGTLIVMRKCRD